MRYAIIENTTVVNVAEASSPQGDNWVLTDIAGPGWQYINDEFVPPTSTAPTPIDVNKERDRRLRANFIFQGNEYQRDPLSMQRIAGAAQIASIAITNGAQAGDLRWYDNSTDFGWISANDNVILMDAPTVVNFGIAAAITETRLIFAARALRQMTPIPEDYTNDKWW